jgi:hypothetical protein
VVTNLERHRRLPWRCRRVVFLQGRFWVRPGTVSGFGRAPFPRPGLRSHRRLGWRLSRMALGHRALARREASLIATNPGARLGSGLVDDQEMPCKTRSFHKERLMDEPVGTVSAATNIGEAPGT